MILGVRTSGRWGGAGSRAAYRENKEAEVDHSIGCIGYRHQSAVSAMHVVRSKGVLYLLWIEMMCWAEN